ncbi:alpha/beta hydrolase [Methanoregula sp.]|uniref:alpha/beta hydrolase family protein n=1 Tax=Methanoregula sp. TaxID=2052170 RepID=UPI0026118A30|nr:alpha/beta hydrolase [Methanoregula sp.]MDD5142297.1 alpha/beta hydrolase [Methanoregula sp.]
MRAVPALVLAAVLIAAAAFAGCSGTGTKASYSVDSSGALSVTCAPVTTSEDVLFSNETYTKTRIVMHTQTGDVVTYLSAPKQPKAAIVYVPGAGEKPEGHEARMLQYAQAGYAFLFVDIRGRGGETDGIPFGQQLIQQDFTKFQSGEWPQYYLTICDLVNARKMLSGRFSVPVYAVGSSNGGRYAAIATGVDKDFAGYVGISTSDWGILDAFTTQGYSGDPIRFAASLEPSTYFAKISPRPVWIFHNATDPIIPFESGTAFYDKAGEPKTFTEFSGDHGINSDVDSRIIMQWAQIYAPSR